MEPDESLGEDARSIAYFDSILQREGERDLFALRQPAMPSDDDADDGHEVEIDSSDDAQEQEQEVEVEL